MDVVVTAIEYEWNASNRGGKRVVSKTIRLPVMPRNGDYLELDLPGGPLSVMVGEVRIGESRLSIQISLTDVTELVNDGWEAVSGGER